MMNKSLDNIVNQISGYENAHLITYETLDRNSPRTYAFDKLRDAGEICGLPVAFVRNKEDGKLYVTFGDNSHVLIVGATGSGKTTGYIIILLQVLAELAGSSVVISDPKGELYASLAKKYEDRGYRVRTLNFRNPSHSDFWNPFTKLYRMYREAKNVGNSVTVVEENGEYYNAFNGKVYYDYSELEADVAETEQCLMAEAENELSSIANIFVAEDNKVQPDWQRNARTVFKALLHGMLEDSDKDPSEVGAITEDNFSMRTLLYIFDSFGDDDGSYNDNGYFTNRPKTSIAYQLAKAQILDNAPNTRRGVITSLESALESCRSAAVTRLMSTNTFDIESLDDEKVAVFLQYSDEREENYKLIEMFMIDLYSRLVKVAEKKGGQLSRPFYFVWDEFGNFPAVPRFSNMMTACRSRNIWLILVLQDYAQLDALYDPASARAIKNNANMRMFYGTNDIDTMRQFSAECLQTTQLTPLSALNGQSEAMDRYDFETVPLVRISDLNTVPEGVCYLKAFRMNPMKTWFERSYRCPEFAYEKADNLRYEVSVRLSDAKYNYKYNMKRRSRYDI